MFADDYFVDISHHSLNKFGEELCGDKVEVVKTDDRMIVVLADGLGSGVKANILATLTTKIMSTMLENGADITETIETIISTLPVCQVRQIGYSTFSILEIQPDLKCRVIEYDNPPAFICREHKIIDIEKVERIIQDKRVKISEFQMELGDEIVLCSDGVIHAGVGHVLNHGWEWSHVAEYLTKQRVGSAEQLTRRLVETCAKLYGEKPGDDTTAVTVKIRRPTNVYLFTGPPENPELDKTFVRKFMGKAGKKVICGGTAANIIARETGRDIETNIDYIDPQIPPTAKIEGFDLVTEGVLTLKGALEKLLTIEGNCQELMFNRADGVSQLLKILFEDSTHIHFWLGRAINPAHQNPDFPKELSIKVSVVKQLVKQLRAMGKIVTLKYMTEEEQIIS